MTNLSKIEFFFKKILQKKRVIGIFLAWFSRFIDKKIYVEISIILSLNLAAHLHGACGTPGVVRHTSLLRITAVDLFILFESTPSFYHFILFLAYLSILDISFFFRKGLINQSRNRTCGILSPSLSFSLSISYLFSLFTFQLLTYDYSFLPFALKFSSFPRVVIIRVELLNYCSLKVSETFEE